MIEIFTTPDGLTLSYERRGTGPLLVCHPGGPGASAAEFEDFTGFPNLDLRAHLRTIAAPTLVVVGEDDFVCGPACADAIVRELPDVRLVEIPDAGHYVYVEQPEVFRAALADFLL